MDKVLLIPDSFKGTMSSGEICGIMKEVIERYYPKAQVIGIPVADGGEGSVDSFLAAIGGEKRTLTVQGPYGEDVSGFYGVLTGGDVVIEMAAAAGLPLVGEDKRAEKTTTYGVGQLIAHAAGSNPRRIIIGLGGSATNDGGAGAAAALGAKFYNRAGDRFIPVGATLSDIDRIDVSGLLPALAGIELVAMCDIDNPLCGPTGAAAVFAPQKGADSEMVRRLDDGLAHMAKLVKRDLGADILDMPGAGAAGGMGGGMVAFLGARLQMGIETVLDAVDFNSLLDGADLVFSGEGKIDSQSLRGKVVIGVARRARTKGIPLIAIVGDIGDDIESVYDEGVTGVFSINHVAVPYREARDRSKNDLALTMDNLMRFMQKMGLQPKTR